MDNNSSLENINIDEHKELFEYEMTEVILKLKGEFAAVSGCGKRYSDAAVDDKSLAVSLKELSAVELADVKTDFPDVSALKIHTFLPGEVAEYQSQLDIISSCPDVHIDTSGLNLSRITFSVSDDTRSKAAASIDRQKMNKAASAAGKSVSEIHKITAAILPHLQIPHVSKLQLNQPDFKMTAVDGKSVQIPHVSRFSEKRHSFSLTSERLSLQIPSCTFSTPKSDFCVCLNDKAFSCKIPSLPKCTDVRCNAPEEKKECLSERPTVPAVFVPNMDESVSAVTKISALSTDASFRIKTAIQEIDSTTTAEKASKIQIPVAKTEITEALQHSKIRRITVPDIPAIKK